jgi:hypothetical protein
VGLGGGGSLRPLIEPRLYAGYCWASGSPTREGIDGRTADRFIVAATLAAGVRSALLSQWDLLADVELGHTLRGMTFLSDDDRVAGLSGVLAAARVGVGFRP